MPGCGFDSARAENHSTSVPWDVPNDEAPHLYFTTAHNMILAIHVSVSTEVLNLKVATYLLLEGCNPFKEKPLPSLKTTTTLEFHFSSSSKRWGEVYSHNILGSL